MNSSMLRSTTTTPRVLDQVSIQQPCPMSWDKMIGDDRVRFCDQCQRQVWNFFEMTDAEIAEVVRSNPESLCAQITKTRDGTLVTKDYRPTQTQFRFSMLAMMALATCLAPLMLLAPSIYRWLTPAAQPPPQASIPTDAQMRALMKINVQQMGGRVFFSPTKDYLDSFEHERDGRSEDSSETHSED